MPQMDGMILIDKPANMTSFGVVARVRRKLSKKAGKKVKVGHTGTLDPFATGLMILLVGKACKQASEFSKLDKTYEATITLGKTSSTGDPEGEISPASRVIPTEEEVKGTLKHFIGAIKQTPPAFSAIKIDGQRAYKLARDGKEVDMPQREVTIHELELVKYAYPELKIRTHVSSGTYIRTLAEDIGKALKTGAYCQQLRRTTVGEWDIKQAVTLGDKEVTSIKPLQ
ncbi:tRNA pseudouridine(55) synthase TruB [Candidatus Saccharibacteria bacterium]|nr:tRNA pseudouridine(55) synthase TruB [Candidatus Saccharibacteria bacterium]